MFSMFSALYMPSKVPVDHFRFSSQPQCFFFTFNHATLIVNQISLSGSLFDFYFITKIWILTIVICVVNSIIENFKLYLKHKVPSDRFTTNKYIDISLH